ncbi:hypothetical protein PILCRDRAFT_817878 [Piloderma croceum F 1598]|uniref:Uncharacterized protein n=1 Tax=Piloderma croceum (strain F 1598) TaxID=765440 RepID=A0A0C3BFG1_PILCF|nr:hypothetical protein PILCRDRAFT_817878 [Piloderma croceum F 1598]
MSLRGFAEQSFDEAPSTYGVCLAMPIYSLMAVAAAALRHGGIINGCIHAGIDHIYGISSLWESIQIPTDVEEAALNM